MNGKDEVAQLATTAYVVRQAHLPLAGEGAGVQSGGLHDRETSQGARIFSDKRAKSGYKGAPSGL